MYIHVEGSHIHTYTESSYSMQHKTETMVLEKKQRVTHTFVPLFVGVEAERGEGAVCSNCCPLELTPIGEDRDNEFNFSFLFYTNTFMTTCFCCTNCCTD